jgi:ribosome-associated protein
LVDALEDKKAENIVLLDVQGQAVFTDYFIICSGSSDRQLHALVEAVEETARKKHRRKGPRVEGRPEGGWVLADFGSVIVHVFSADKRKHYRLEELWHEGKIVVRIQ